MTAAEYDESSTTLYLLSGDDIMYELSVSDEPPTCSYTLLLSYTLTQNVPTHSFSSVSGSSTAPTGIDTFMITADLLRAVVGDMIHDYNRTTQEWKSQGAITWL